ncbi:MAG: D-alanyl-D-alanine carboxypeptidase [Alphaproteobacteria bacterium]|nr:D-alanyl-D-alanine carboxypeptidase [Alphaproteobacteria bacterium]
MRRMFIILSAILACTAAHSAQYRAALVADMDTGRVLYQENANELNYPASLTKIMTLYLTFDALEHGRLNLNDYLIVSQSAANAEPVKLGLPAGSKIRVEDAIKALAVHSANDVARVLAENLKGGQEESFADLMTRVAREIGLTRTNFENSSGLPNDDHMSTARDIALLSMAVYKHFPQYWHFFGIKSWTYNGKTYTNGNRLLGSYAGCDGMKTGYTKKSKYSLVATANRDNKRLMSVVLGAENKDVRANVAAQMLNRGFSMLNNGATPVSVTKPVAQSVPQPSPQPSYTPPPPPAPTQPVTTFNAAYNAATSAATPVYSKPTTSAPVANSVPGSAGVQFGAFSSRSSAETQVQNVKNKLGVNAVIETASNGMYRVRVNGLSESAAQQIKSNATANGIDSYVFH